MKMDNKNLKTPQNLYVEVRGLDLGWMNVMGSQVDHNYDRYLARVKEDALRSKSVLPLRAQLAEAPQCKRSLFCDSGK